MFVTTFNCAIVSLSQHNKISRQDLLITSINNNSMYSRGKYLELYSILLRQNSKIADGSMQTILMEAYRIGRSCSLRQRNPLSIHSAKVMSIYWYLHVEPIWGPSVIPVLFELYGISVVYLVFILFIASWLRWSKLVSHGKIIECFLNVPGICNLELMKRSTFLNIVLLKSNIYGAWTKTCWWLLAKIYGPNDLDLPETVK